MTADWWTAGWQDLVPEQGLFVHMVVATATARDRDGDLRVLFAAVPAQESGRARVRLEDPVVWLSPQAGLEDQEQERRTALYRQRTWEQAVAAVGLSVPATVGELAEVLVTLGVFQRSWRTGPADRVERWRSPEVLPLAADQLPLPAEWVAAHEEAGRRQQGELAAQRLIRFLHEHRRPHVVITTVAELATATGLPAVATRRGLAALRANGDFRLLPHNATAGDPDPKRIGLHTEFTLAADWQLFDLMRTRIAPAEKN